jgi:hypothetical protein
MTTKKKGPTRGKPTPTRSSKPKPAKEPKPLRVADAKADGPTYQRMREATRPVPAKKAAVTPRLVASVSGQVVDTSGNPWGFAIVQFSLFVPSGGRPIELSTGLVIPRPAPVVCDVNGNFTSALQKNDGIVPASLWQLTVYPFNNQIDGQTLEPFQCLGPLDLSAPIKAQLKPHFDAPLILPMSNNGSVGQSTLNGSTYFDVESEDLMIFNPATGDYVAIGQAVATYPREGVAVSTGTSWDPSIDPATIPRVDASEVLTLTGAEAALTLNGDTVPDATGNVARLNLGVNNATGQEPGTFIFYTSNPSASSNQKLSVEHFAPDVGLASLFTIDHLGNFFVNGTIGCSGLKTFKIPHPLDPEKVLTHACLEGPESAVYYRGETITRDGKADVTLPDYFEALTRVFGRTVLLTQVSDDQTKEFAMLMASPVTDGGFSIHSSIPRARVYWEVKAIRADIPPLLIVSDKEPAQGEL